MRPLLILLVLGLLLSCRKSGKQVLPTNKIFTADQLQKGADYSRQKGGAAVMVMQDGKTIFENYHNGASATTATHIQSGTKGFFAAVVALALQEGLMGNYEEIVAETITEWQDGSIFP